MGSIVPSMTATRDSVSNLDSLPSPSTGQASLQNVIAADVSDARVSSSVANGQSIVPSMTATRDSVSNFDSLPSPSTGHANVENVATPSASDEAILSLTTPLHLRVMPGCTTHDSVLNFDSLCKQPPSTAQSDFENVVAADATASKRDSVSRHVYVENV